MMDKIVSFYFQVRIQKYKCGFSSHISVLHAICTSMQGLINATTLIGGNCNSILAERLMIFTYFNS